jgi:hypothetical protein
MGWVYAIECPARGLIKVGRTDGDDPRKRLRQLQTGQPDQLVLMHAWPTSDSRQAERCMHQLLVRHHFRGEWFNVTPAQVVEAWARVATGRLGWWYRVRWWVTLAGRRVRRSVALAVEVTGLATWLVLAIWALLHLV